MGSPCGQIEPVASLKREFFAINGKGDLALEDPEALVVIMSMSRIARSGDIVPTKGLVTFLVEPSFGLFFGRWGGFIPGDDFDRCHRAGAPSEQTP